jgi:predicted permease
MESFALIAVCLIGGIVMRRFNLVGENAHRDINVWVLYVALPALILLYLPQIEWSEKALLPAIAPIVVWSGAWIFVAIYDRKRKLSPASRAALFVVCGLGNTAFIGFPMTTAFYGKEALKTAIIFDQVTFLIFATMGVVTILRHSETANDQTNFYRAFKKILRFPPFIAAIVALTLPRVIDISILDALFSQLAATVSPMALFSIGLQLRLGEVRSQWRFLSAGIVYKLAIAPLLVVVLALAFGANGELAKVTVFEAAMSSHITATLLIAQHNLNSRYCSLIVGFGVAIGFITTAIWYAIMERLF